MVRSADELPRAAAPRPDASLADRFRPDTASFPIPLPGGLPRGALVEVVGRRSSGRFALALAALAAATQMGEPAALVDLGDHLDPQGAAAEGVDLARVLWVRPTNLKDALSSAELVLGAGFSLVVLDLGLRICTGRNRHMPVPPGPPSGDAGASRRSNMSRLRLESAWIRLARRAKSHEAALLVLTPYRASGTAATVVLTARSARALWAGAESPREDDVDLRALSRSALARPLLAGLETRLVVEKERGGAPGAARRLTLRTPSLVTGLNLTESPESTAVPAPPLLRKVGHG